MLRFSVALIRAYMVLIIAVYFSSAALASGLTSSQATVAVYCCTAPIESNRISNFATANVGTSVEFPVGSLQSIGSQGVIQTSIDISASTLTVTYAVSATNAPGTFNGYLFSFADSPQITNVTLDAASTLTPVGFAFTSHTFQINTAGKSIPASAKEIFDITTVPNLNGDYNGNGKIDAPDYVVWRDTLAAGGTYLLNDPTPGTVDISDYSYWRTHFGNSIGSGAQLATVPEPQAIQFILSICTCCCILGRHRTR